MSRMTSAGLVLVVAFSPFRLEAAKPQAADLLPPSVVLYAESASSDTVLDEVLAHPLRSQIEGLPPYQAWLASDDAQELAEGIAYFESQLGMPWRQAVEKLGEGGLHFAFDGGSRSAALLLHADDHDFLAEAVETLVAAVRADHANKGEPDPFKHAEYRGVSAYRAEDIRFAAIDGWLVLASSDQLGKKIVDRILDGRGPSLADAPQFRKAVANRSDDALAWGYAHVGAIRSAGVAKELLGGKAVDPGAELIFGGVLNALHHAPYAAAQLSASDHSWELALSVPHEAAWIPSEREFYFGPDLAGAAPAAIDLPDTLAEVRLYRGVSGMWLAGPELFNEEANAALAKANSDLSTLFGGKPFAEEILGALTGDLRLVVVREEHPQPAAAVRLPGFAAVGRLKDPAESVRPLRIAFQTAVGFANLMAAQEGRPALELETVRSDGRTMVSASFYNNDAAGAADQGDEAMMREGSAALNLSPTVGFADNAIVLSSTRTLAEKLLDQLQRKDQKASSETGRAAATTPQPVTNTAIEIESAPLRTVLAENRERLIANNMLEKGHDRGEAEAEIDALLTLLSFLRGAEAELTIGADQLRISVRVHPVKE